MTKADFSIILVFDLPKRPKRKKEKAKRRRTFCPHSLFDDESFLILLAHFSLAGNGQCEGGS